MIIKTLVENTSISENLGSEHGLSLYIETKKNKILFDLGASDLFFKNSKKMNIDIHDIDYIIISHGHYDHGGGLKTFLSENKKAKVFVNKFAFDEYYALRSNKEYGFIGLEENLKGSNQIVFTSENFVINEEMEVFSNITKKEAIPNSNKNLFIKKEGNFVNDDFIHEQVLVIKEKEKTVLITGCAHNGIINILEHFKSLKGYIPEYVIGGFHLSSPGLNISEAPETIKKISDYLLKTNTKYYTCHCTGMEAYKILKNSMKDRIDYISSGSEIII